MSNQPGHQIATLRKRRGFTQIDLGTIAEVSTTTIARIETGKTDPRLSTLERVARALDATLVVAFE